MKYTALRSLSLALLALLLLTVPAFAANPHFVEGPTVTLSADNSTLTTSGKIAGLGNQDVTLVQSIDVAVTCANPGYNSDVPGQRKSFSSTESNLRPENGNLVFSITTSVGDLSGSCPNAQWTASGTIVSGTLEVYQRGKLVLSTSVL